MPITGVSVINWDVRDGGQHIRLRVEDSAGCASYIEKDVSWDEINHIGWHDIMVELLAIAMIKQEPGFCAYMPDLYAILAGITVAEVASKATKIRKEWT